MSSNWSECHRAAGDRSLTSVGVGIASEPNSDLSQTTDNDLSANQVSSNACDLYWNYLKKSIGDDFFMVSLYNDVDSIIQMGPKYGSLSKNILIPTNS